MAENTPGLEPLTAEQRKRFQALLDSLDSFRKKRRTSAGRIIRGMPPDLVFRLAEMESERFQTRSRKGSYVSAAVLAGFALWFYRTPASNIEAQGTIFLALGVACLTLIAGLNILLPFRASKTIAAIISEQEDTRFVGLALEMLSRSDAPPQNRGYISATLCRLLPRMRADQRDLLTREQQRLLLIPLKSPMKNRALTLAVLKGLEQIGDAWAIPAVRELTDYWNGPSWGVGNAALECLAFLELRAAQSLEAKTLLRASEPADARAPDVLVRPACGPLSDTPPEHLLRAHFKRG